MSQDLIPKVGLGVMIFKDDKILLGLRKGSHAPGVYSFPGGHLEYLESFEDCVRRETLEECGIEISDIKFLSLANLDQYKPKHYVNIILVANWKSGEPQLLEPDKFDHWIWRGLDELPDNLFPGCKFAVKAYTQGYNYFDII